MKKSRLQYTLDQLPDDAEIEEVRGVFVVYTLPDDIRRHTKLICLPANDMVAYMRKRRREDATYSLDKESKDLTEETT